MQVNNISVLGNINVVSVSLKFFGGSASLTAEDLGIDTSVLPADVVALGSKKIVNKDLLKGFGAARKNVQRKGLLKGTAFLGGYAMSPEASVDFLDEVKVMLSELESDMETFLTNYPTYVQDWAKMHPKWSDAIVAAAPSVQSVRSRFQFKVRCFKVSEPGDTLADGGLVEEISGLAGQILSEIARDVKLTWKDRGYGAQQIKSLLRRVSEKAKALSFINSDLTKICVLINDTLSSLPITGKIEGRDYLQLKGLMDMLMDPQMVLASMKQGDLAILVADESEALVANESDALVAEASDAFVNLTPVLDSSDSIIVEVFQPDVAVSSDISTPVALPQPDLPANASWA